MKKLLKIALTLGMVFCLSVTAFASQSGSGPVNPGPSTNASPTGAVDPATGATVQITEEPASVTPTVTELATVIAAAVPDVTAEDLSIPYVRDLTSEVLPVTISFEIPGATAEDTVYVLHYDGTAWEVVATCPGNAITATFTDLSPVALAMELAPADPSNGTTDSDSDTSAPSNGTTGNSSAGTTSTGTTSNGTTGTRTSPRTGEGLTMVYAGGVLLLAGAVALTARKKEKER